MNDRIIFENSSILKAKIGNPSSSSDSLGETDKMLGAKKFAEFSRGNVHLCSFLGSTENQNPPNELRTWN